MKKSLKLLSGILFVAIGLTGCKGNEPTQGGDIPVGDDCTTFYFTLAEGSVDFKEYETVYLTGGFYGWVTGYDAIALELLEGTTTYYAVVTNDTLDFTASQGTEYNLVLGYNETAQMPAASSGLQWVDGRKSEECAAPGGLDNLSFEYTEGQQTIDLGTHTFSKSLSAPTAPLQNYGLKVTFAEAVPEYAKVLVFGSFNGWKTPGDDEEVARQYIQDATMTPNTERTEFTLTLSQVIAGDYECIFCVEYVTAETSISWNKVDQTQNNYAFTITVADGDNYVLDVLGENATYTLADPTQSVALTLKVVNTNTSAEGGLTAETIYVCGAFNSWTHEELTKVTDDEWQYTNEAVNTLNFGVMSKTDWSDKVHIGGNNLCNDTQLDLTKDTVTVTVKCDFAKLGVEAQEISAEDIIVSQE